MAIEDYSACTNDHLFSYKTGSCNYRWHTAGGTSTQNNKNLEEAFAFRPMRLIINEHLEKEIVKEGNLSANQYGFRINSGRHLQSFRHKKKYK